MEDLFKELIQGSGQQSSGQEEAGDPLSGILQGLLGGGTLGSAQPAAEPPSGLGGAGGLDIASLLQGLLGGGGALGPGAQGTTSTEEISGMSSGGMGDILGAIMGGGGATGSGVSEASGIGAGGLGGILGAILGGGSPATQSDPFTSAIANVLSKKLGLPPQIAHAVVVFVLGKLLKGRQATSGSSAQGGVQGMSLDGLLGRMNSGAAVRKSDIRATGMAQELAAYTGMDRRTAEASLQEVLNALGGRVGGAAQARTTGKPKQSGLDAMLDEWPK